MAQASDDELERGATAEASPNAGSRSAGVPLADEGADELPALLAIVVGIAVLVIGLIWPSINEDAIHNATADPTAGSAESAVDEGAEGETTEAEADAGDESAEGSTAGDDAAAGAPDLPAIQAILDAEAPGLSAAVDGRTVTLTGTVADDAARQAIVAQVGALPDVDAVDDQLELAPLAEAAVTATAGQVSMVLTGTVPDEATREAIVAKAIEVYSEAQVDDQLVVDDSAGAPALVTLVGAMTDPVLHGQVEAAFADLAGVELADSSGFDLEESSELEAALNALEPIQFASGSALVDPESAAILDEAADLLIADATVAIEIGGHTDSLGGEAANQTLSEARARAVLDELVARGVGNDLSAVGFGERRLKVSPDEDDPAAQQENRRIEFRII